MSILFVLTNFFNDYLHLLASISNFSVTFAVPPVGLKIILIYFIIHKLFSRQNEYHLLILILYINTITVSHGTDKQPITTKSVPQIPFLQYAPMPPVNQTILLCFLFFLLFLFSHFFLTLLACPGKVLHHNLEIRDK